MSAEQDKTVFSMRPRMELDVDDLAEAILDGTPDDDEGKHVLELIGELDSQMMEWTFTLRLVRRVLTLARSYVEETYAEGGSEYERLMGAVEDTIDVFGRELRVVHGIEEKP